MRIQLIDLRESYLQIIGECCTIYYTSDSSLSVLDVYSSTGLLRVTPRWCHSPIFLGSPHIADNDQLYSHLNGLEFLKYNKSQLFEQIESIISKVDANSLRIKVSREKTKPGKMLYYPASLNSTFKKYFREKGWDGMRRDISTK